MRYREIIETKKFGEEWVATLKNSPAKSATGTTADKAFKALVAKLGGNTSDYRHHELT